MLDIRLERTSIASVHYIVRPELTR